MNHVYMRFPNGKARALTLSYDDGVEQDIKLMELLKAYQVKCTFNINSGAFAPEGRVFEKGTIHRRMTEKMCKELFDCDLAEVAIHGVTHPFFDKVPPSVMMSQAVDDRKNLEEMFGKIIRGMAYPFGTTNDTVVEVLKLAGIVYARTVQSHHNFNLPTNWLRWGATCHHKDPELLRLAHRFIEEDVKKDPYLFYLWGHSYEFEADDNWDVIEEFLSYIAGKDDVWYATNIEIYEYTEAFHRLVYSADGGMVYNPSNMAVCFVVDNKAYEVAAGATIRL